MRPLTSGLSTTPRRERKLATAWMSSVSVATSTLATSTDGGRSLAPRAGRTGSHGLRAFPGVRWRWPLIPPRGSRSSGDADDGDQRIEYF